MSAPTVTSNLPVNTLTVASIKGFGSTPPDFPAPFTIAGATVVSPVHKKPTNISAASGSLVNITSANIAVNSPDLLTVDVTNYLRIAVTATPTAAGTLSSFTVNLPNRTTSSTDFGALKVILSGQSGTSSTPSALLGMTFAPSGTGLQINFYSNAVESHYIYAYAVYDTN